jgi:hypothetical protein
VRTPFDSNSFHVSKTWNERERVVKLGFSGLAKQGRYDVLLLTIKFQFIQKHVLLVAKATLDRPQRPCTDSKIAVDDAVEDAVNRARHAVRIARRRAACSRFAGQKLVATHQRMDGLQ